MRGCDMAVISVDVRRRIDEISPLIYGNFIEHLGKCIYGGVYDPESPLADEKGFRRDVMEAAKRLNVTILRWPGGNFVSGYHWMDGIGPKESRPRRMDLAWHTVESNQFGTDEFVEFCRLLDTEPYICVNMGNGTMDEAQAWVEYCNGTEETYYAELRRKYGHEEPYGVKFWGLGNEVSGNWQIGHKEAEDYAKLALEFAKVMRWTDPSIKLIACGSCMQNAYDMNWNRIVVEKLTGICDYIAIHMYVNNRQDNYYEYMATSERIERYIRAVRGIIDWGVYHNNSKRMKIAFDEWNATPSFPHDHPKHGRYTLEDALVVAMFLNSFIRNADYVKIANMAQLVNVIPPIVTEPDDMFLQTIFFPLELYANENGSVALDVHCECDSFESHEYGRVPYLDVSASYNPENGHLSINVVNRHLTDSISAKIENQFGRLIEAGMAFEITGEDVKVTNDFSEKENVKTVKKPISVPGNEFTYEFPPHSITTLKLAVG
jgi:alpha-N-arabinofuranosidase